jgi:hypothetical protein
MTTHTAKRLARTGLVAGMAFAFVPILGISPAQACSCVSSDEKEHFQRADAVFKGTLPPGTQTGGGQSDTIMLTFDATRVYKGTVVAKQKVRTSGSGASCGLEISGAGPWLVFATLPWEGEEKAAPAADPAKQVYEASLCGGTRAIGADEDPSFGPGKPVEQPAPGDDGESDNGGSGDEGDEDGKGGAYGLFAAVLATIAAVLGSLLGWGARS